MLCLAASAVGSPAVVTAVDVSGCAAGEYSAFSAQEVSQIFANPFFLDNDSAAAVGVSILLLMAVAFLFRMARRLVDTQPPFED